MRYRLIIATLSLLYVFIFAIVFWLGDTSHETTASNGPLMHSGENTSTPAMLANSFSPNSVLADTPASSAIDNLAANRKNAPLSPEEKQTIFTEFFKAADMDMIRVRHDLEKAKADGASAADIAEKQALLQRMQAAMQKMQKSSQTP